MKKRIIVRGPALSRSGYGEQCRFAIRSLRAYEDLFDIYLVNTSWGVTGWVWGNDDERQWVDMILSKTHMAVQQNVQFDISLQVTIPNEWEKLAPINIGYTAGIESTKITPIWIEKSQLMDRIIVVSNHAKYGFDNTTYEVTHNKTGQVIKDFRCKTPVVAVNYPIRPTEPAELDVELNTKFNFLAVAQWGPRKNLDNTIKWFVEEFKDDEDVGLVLKVNVHNNSTMDAHFCEKKLQNLLSQHEDRKCKVYLLHGDMSDSEMNALYNHPKIHALVTLTHGEGFGLPIFEAAYNELPVIAPEWGGHCDFMYMPVKDKKKSKARMRPAFLRVDYDLKPVQKEAIWEGVVSAESFWCFAKKHSYKARLREMIKDHKRLKSQAKKLTKYINENFTSEAKYGEFVEAMAVNTGAIQQEENHAVLVV